MKIGPRPFTCTFSSAGTPAGLQGVPGIVGTTMTYFMQTVAATMTSLPVDCRGAMDKSFQLIGTFSPITNVAIDATIDPQAITAPATASWYTIGTLVTPSIVLIHSGIVRAFRARTQAVSSTDSFGLVYLVGDQG